METREISAKTVEEALELALRELDASREEVEVNIISPGKAGFLGLGAEPARVSVRKLPPSADAATSAMSVLNKILSGVKTKTVATLRIAHDVESGGPVIEIEGEDSGLLIGRRGETLRALQFLVNVIINSNRSEKTRVSLDVEQYRARRERVLREMAMRVASRVTATRRSITLEPMNAAERRIIHITLADRSDVMTESVGFGNDRKVTVALSE